MLIQCKKDIVLKIIFMLIRYKIHNNNKIIINLLFMIEIRTNIIISRKLLARIIYCKTARKYNN